MAATMERIPTALFRKEPSTQHEDSTANHSITRQSFCNSATLDASPSCNGFPAKAIAHHCRSISHDHHEFLGSMVDQLLHQNLSKEEEGEEGNISDAAYLTKRLEDRFTEHMDASLPLGLSSAGRFSPSTRYSDFCCDTASAIVCSPVHGAQDPEEFQKSLGTSASSSSSVPSRILSKLSSTLLRSGSRMGSPLKTRTTPRPSIANDSNSMSTSSKYTATRSDSQQTTNGPMATRTFSMTLANSDVCAGSSKNVKGPSSAPSSTSASPNRVRSSVAGRNSMVIMAASGNAGIGTSGMGGGGGVVCSSSGVRGLLFGSTRSMAISRLSGAELRTGATFGLLRTESDTLLKLHDLNTVAAPAADDMASNPRSSASSSAGTHLSLKHRRDSWCLNKSGAVTTTMQALSVSSSKPHSLTGRRSGLVLDAKAEESRMPRAATRRNSSLRFLDHAVDSKLASPWGHNASSSSTSAASHGIVGSDTADDDEVIDDDDDESDAEYVIGDETMVEVSSRRSKSTPRKPSSRYRSDLGSSGRHDDNSHQQDSNGCSHVHLDALAALKVREEVNPRAARTRLGRTLSSSGEGCAHQHGGAVRVSPSRADAKDGRSSADDFDEWLRDGGGYDSESMGLIISQLHGTRRDPSCANWTEIKQSCEQMDEVHKQITMLDLHVNDDGDDDGGSSGIVYSVVDMNEETSDFCDYEHGDGDEDGDSCGASYSYQHSRSSSYYTASNGHSGTPDSATTPDAIFDRLPEHHDFTASFSHSPSRAHEGKQHLQTHLQHRYARQGLPSAEPSEKDENCHISAQHSPGCTPGVLNNFLTKLRWTNHGSFSLDGTNETLSSACREQLMGASRASGGCMNGGKASSSDCFQLPGSRPRLSLSSCNLSHVLSSPGSSQCELLDKDLESPEFLETINSLDMRITGILIQGGDSPHEAPLKYIIDIDSDAAQGRCNAADVACHEASGGSRITDDHPGSSPAHVSMVAEAQWPNPTVPLSTNRQRNVHRASITTIENVIAMDSIFHVRSSSQ